ncbi:MAG: transcription termination/antitermination factor NusG [Candidatus Cloacimonetes bacterium]|nr:transcription termination/antitermination factor NusG [Candidatus Cloacimonadota bacterium]
MKWYVVHTYAMHEFKIRETIEKGIKGTDLEDKIGQILIPVQKTFHFREGKKVEREKKLFNSYIIIEAELTPEVFTYIKGLPGVTNFLGTGKKPQALPEYEVKKLLGMNERDTEATSKHKFLPGDMVKITAGAFSDFDGAIEKISDDQKKLTIKVTVFGRVTPVEVSSEDVEAL